MHSKYSVYVLPIRLLYLYFQHDDKGNLLRILDVIDKCNKLADQYGVKFFYQDFREGWQQGIDDSIKMDLYRQPYCGCIYSEQERYDKKLRKKMRQRQNNE